MYLIREVLQAIYEELTTQEISENLFISPKTVEAQSHEYYEQIRS